MSMKLLKNPLIWKILFYSWIVSIAVLTSLPYSGEGEKHAESAFRWDYLQHFLFYSALSILFYLSYGSSLNRNNRKTNLLILFTGIFFASVTEFHQFFIPGRAFNPVDLMLNVSGLILGIPVGRFLFRCL